MVRVLSLAGRTLLDIPSEQLSDVRALKQLLRKRCTLSFFKLEQNGNVLDGQEALDMEADVQLVELPKPSKKQYAALYTASYMGQEDDVATLLLDWPRGHGLMEVFLQVACKQGREKVVSLLLEAAAPLEVIDKSGYTPLLLACNAGQTETVQLLLQVRADKEHVATDGQTARSLALGRGHRPILQLLGDA